MFTEVVQDANPKLVQFTSALTVYVRDMPEARPMNISVKFQNAVGTSTVAQAYVPAVVAMEWVQVIQRGKGHVSETLNGLYVKNI